MINKQISIQDLLLQDNHSVNSQDSISKTQEFNMNESFLQEQDQNIAVLPPKIFLFKSMVDKNRNCNQIDQKGFQNNKNDINSNPTFFDSQINPTSLDDMQTLTIVNPINQCEASLPRSNVAMPAYTTFVPSPIMQLQQQQNISIMPQINTVPKNPESYKTSPSNSRIRWTKQEDEQLMSLVRKWGARKWNEIAASLVTKTAKQCRDHYANCLDPEIKNSLWTVEEEQILLLKYEQLGPHWSRIKNFLPGRTTSMIKNYITMLLKKNGKELTSSNQEHKEKPESVTSSNTSSENDEHDNDDFESKEIQAQENGFAIHDINFLLNRPAHSTG